MHIVLRDSSNEYDFLETRMKLREERVRLHRSDCAVGSISWLPDNLAERAQQEEGWLACGNRNGMVSVTFSSVRTSDDAVPNTTDTRDEEKERTNFNIGSHKSQVHLVSWNVAHRKLATCSVLGAIFVYQKSQGRWNVDLINDRSLQVQEFRWSHSCQRVLIAYTDGLVVMGTVQGQRLWQRIVDLPRPPDQAPPAPAGNVWAGQVGAGAGGVGGGGGGGGGVGGGGVGVGGGGFDLLVGGEPAVAPGGVQGEPGAQGGLPGGSLDELVLTCGTWSPGDRRITVGTSTGYLVTFAVQWNRLPLHLSRQSDRLLAPGIRVTQLLWSCPVYSPDIVDPAQPDETPIVGGAGAGGAAAAGAEAGAAGAGGGGGGSSGAGASAAAQAEVGGEAGTGGTEGGAAAAAAAAAAADAASAEAKWLEADYAGHRLAVAFETGHIYLMDEPEDGDADLITTGLINVKLAWSCNGQLLAVGGFVRSANLECACHVQLYSRTGQLVFTIPVYSAGKPISSLCWAHNDRRLFVAANCYVHTLCVEEEFPSLQLSTALYLYERLRWKRQAAFDQLPLPVHLRSIVRRAGHHTIKTCLPEPHRLREFVLLPRRERLYCTVMRNDHDTDTPSRYTMYLEFMGGLIPLLRARKLHGLKPDFIIYDPKIAAFKTDGEEEPFPFSSEGESSGSEDNGASGPEEDVEPRTHNSPAGLPPSLPGSPLANLQRRESRRRRRNHKHCRLNRNAIRKIDGPPDVLFYNDRLPECHRLAAVQSNVWGNRFRLLGLAPFLPPLLGTVNFRKSVLRSQPREMTISVCELTANMNEKAQRLRNAAAAVSSSSSASQHAMSQSPTSVADSSCPSCAVEAGLESPDMELQVEASLSGEAEGLFSVSSCRSDPPSPCAVPASTPRSSGGFGGARSLLRDCVRRQHEGGSGGEAAALQLAAASSHSAPSTPVKTSLLRRKKSQIEGLLSPRRSLRRRLHSQRHAGPPPTAASPLSAADGAAPQLAAVGDHSETAASPFLRHTEGAGSRGKKLKKATRISDSCAPSLEGGSEPFRYFTLHNRKPVWNENLQVYQLDFGGRVTQESTKNFQVDLDDRQILQFGRLNANTFALDFQYPFSPLQAFAVSLTNVTCRFK